MLEIGDAAVQHHVFHRQQVAAVHGKTAQAETEQQSGVARVAGHFAAHGYRLAHAVGGADDVGEQAHHGGVGGLVEIGDGIVAAIDRQGVLDQIVGADGYEVEIFEQAGHGECGGRDFDHAADFDVAEGFAALGELAAGGVQVDQALFELGQAGNHRPHHFDFAEHGGAQNGAHLGAEHHRLGVAQTDAGEPQRGVGGGVGRAVAAEPARVFIHAQIDGADGAFFAFEFFNGFGVGVKQLVFVGQVVAVEIEKLTAQQADAVGAEFEQVFDFAGAFDIGQEFDLFAVERSGGGVFEFVELALAAFVFAQQTAVFGEHDFVGLDNQGAGDAVHHHPFVFADQRTGVAQTDYRRNVQAAAEYGGVAGGAAGVGYEAFDALVFEINGIGGGKVVGDQNGVVQQIGIEIDFGALAGQVFLDALDHLQHILLAGAQVFVADVVKLAA